MSDLLRFLLLGLGPGGIYALLAVGIVLVYRGSGIVNFSSGGIALVGAAAFIELRGAVGTPGAVVGGILAAAIVGIAVQTVLLQPMRRAAPLTRVVATLGVMATLELGAELRFGTQSRFEPPFLPSSSVHLTGDVVVAADRLVILAITVAISAALWAVYRFTTFGIATTAVAENQRTTAAAGWSPTRIAAVNWALGGALAGGAGVLLTPLLGFTPTVFTLTIVPALAAAVIASFRSFPLAVIGGLAVGVLESEGTYLQARYPEHVLGVVPTHGLASAIPFLVMIAFMVGRGRALPVRGHITDHLPRLGSGLPRPRAIVVGFALVCASLPTFAGQWASAVSISATVTVIALSVVVVTGYAGQLSLTQYALAGFGALVSSRLADAAGLPFLLAGLTAMGATVAMGLVVALPAVRVRGVNLAVVTLGLAVVISSVVLGNPDFNGGALRGTRIPDPALFGLNVQSVKHPERWAMVCLAVLLLCAMAISNLRRGRTGRRLIAVRGNERAAASLGVHVVGTKLYAFAVGAALAGLGGVLLAFRNTSVGFDQYDPFRSIEIVLLTVIGGIGFLIGALVAGSAAVGGIVPQSLGHLWATDDWFRFILSVLFLIAIVVHPDGFAERISGLVARLERRHKRRLPDLPTDGPARGGQRAAPVPPKALEVRGLSVRFGGTVVLDGVDLLVSPGEVVGLIGPNGAGKTTLLDAVTGFLPKYGGHVLLDGKPIDQLGASGRVRAGLTRSFQSLELFEDLSVGDNLRVASDDGRAAHLVQDLFWPRHQELPGAARSAVREFSLEGLLDRRPAEISYAQRRAVGIARAVAASPSVLLLDEPAAGLDLAARQELERLVRQLAEQWRMAVLLIEHDVPLVMRTCDRVVMLNFGRVVASGPPADVRRDEAVISAYIGEPLDPERSSR